jgi:hypothetical protein
LAQQQPVDHRFQHRRFADADRASQDQVATLARFAGDLLDPIVTPN